MSPPDLLAERPRTNRELRSALAERFPGHDSADLAFAVQAPGPAGVASPPRAVGQERPGCAHPHRRVGDNRIVGVYHGLDGLFAYFRRGRDKVWEACSVQDRLLGSPERRRSRVRQRSLWDLGMPDEVLGVRVAVAGRAGEHGGVDVEREGDLA